LIAAVSFLRAAERNMKDKDKDRERERQPRQRQLLVCQAAIDPTELRRRLDLSGFFATPSSSASSSASDRFDRLEEEQDTTNDTDDTNDNYLAAVLLRASRVQGSQGGPELAVGQPAWSQRLRQGGQGGQGGQELYREIARHASSPHDLHRFLRFCLVQCRRAGVLPLDAHSLSAHDLLSRSEQRNAADPTLDLAILGCAHYYFT